MSATGLQDKNLRAKLIYDKKNGGKTYLKHQVSNF